MDPRFNLVYCAVEGCTVSVEPEQGLCKEHRKMALDQVFRDAGIVAKPKRSVCPTCERSWCKPGQSMCKRCKQAKRELSENVLQDPDDVFGDL